MTLLPILTIPNKKLRLVTEPVGTLTDELIRRLDDMLETMYDAPGIGLAAPQVGDMRRMIVMDVDQEQDRRGKPWFMINPQIIAHSDETVVTEEGCLSIPGVMAEVTRPAEVRVSYIDRKGEPREEDCAGLLAVCVQHEIDHLNGVLFIDYLSRLKRNRIEQKMLKEAKDRQKV